MNLFRRIVSIFFIISAFTGLLMFALSGCSSASDNNETANVTELEVIASGNENIRINEIMSNNSHYAPLPDGSCCDWIEIYNPTDESVNIRDYYFSDNIDEPKKWIVPDDYIIEPHRYFIIYMSGYDGTDEYGNLHAGFKLSSQGESLLFGTASGQLLQMIEIPECTTENISYGIDEHSDSFDFLWMAEPSPGAESSGSMAFDSADLEFHSNGIIISEYMTNNTFTVYDRDGEYSDWIELYNPTDKDVSLAGCALSDKGVYDSRWYFPDDTVIRAGEYMLVFCSGKQTVNSSELHASFSLGQTDTSLTYFSPSGFPVLSAEISNLPDNVSCGIDPNSGEWVLFSEATPGRANDTYAYPMTSILLGTPASDVVFSETLAVSSAMTGDKLTYDYIELYNTSSEEINLVGYGISDNSNEIKFVFPEITLPANEYILVRCTGRDNTQSYSGTGSLTAAFKLDQGGEKLYLYYPDGHLADVIDSGKQVYGVTRGRLTDDLSRLHYFSTATPGKANLADSAMSGYAPQPEFSINGGIVEKDTVIYLSCPEGYTVRYTSDGRKPNSSSKIYDPESGITISSSKAVSAAAFKDGCMVSQTVTSTFLVGVDHDLPIVCMTSDPDGLFSKATGIYSSGTGLLGNKPNYQSSEERQCVIEYYVDGKRAVTFNAGARIFGVGSRTYNQKSFALLLREKYGTSSITFPFFEDNSVTTFSSLVLRQSGQECKRSKLRDELASAIVKNQVSCDYMDQTPVVLYINGEYWGLYYIREKLNEDYLVNKYGYEKGNIDIVKNEYSATAGTYTAYQKLLNFCYSNNLATKANYEKMCEMVNMESLMDFWICETFFANNDTSNIRAYCTRDGSGKWSWMLYDLDNAFYPYQLRRDFIEGWLTDPEGHGIYNECTNVIIRKLLKNKQFRSDFLRRYCYHLKYTFTPERTTALLDEMAGRIKSEIPNQYERWGWPSVNTWKGYVNDIRKFLNNRHTYVIRHLKKEFDLSDKEFKAIYDAC